MSEAIAAYGLGLEDVTAQTRPSEKLAHITNLGLNKHPSALASHAQSLWSYSTDSNSAEKKSTDEKHFCSIQDDINDLNTDIGGALKTMLASVVRESENLCTQKNIDAAACETSNNVSKSQKKLSCTREVFKFAKECGDNVHAGEKTWDSAWSWKWFRINFMIIMFWYFIFTYFACITIN